MVVFLKIKKLTFFQRNLYGLKEIENIFTPHDAQFNFPQILLIHFLVNSTFFVITNWIKIYIKFFSWF
jgi:hypothetical protein